jgi:hypothetical protein
VTGPEHLLEGKRLLAKAAENQWDEALRASIATEAHAHLTAALVTVLAAALLPERLSRQGASDA